MMSKPVQETSIRIPPPVIFLGSLLLAFLLNFYGSFPIVPDVLRFTLGPALMIASISVMPSVFRSFKCAHTPYNVQRIPVALVSEGAFRYSRNPGYAALVVCCIGIAILSDNLWIILTTGLVSLYLHLVVIPVEEKHLEEQFGTSYLDYKAHVRRWL